MGSGCGDGVLSQFLDVTSDSSCLPDVEENVKEYLDDVSAAVDLSSVLHVEASAAVLSLDEFKDVLSDLGALSADKDYVLAVLYLRFVAAGMKPYPSDGLECDEILMNTNEDTLECINDIVISSWRLCPAYLRLRFVESLILYKSINVHTVWDACYRVLSGDVLAEQKIVRNNPGLELSDVQLEWYGFRVMRKVMGDLGFHHAGFEGYFRIASLNPNMGEWSVSVKILNCWSVSRGTGRELNMILGDEYFTQIQAVVRDELIDNYLSRLIIDEWVSIKNFDVSRVNSILRPVPHRFKIVFRSDTLVQSINMCSSRTYFNVTEFVSILSGIVNPNICVDVVGKIVNVRELVFVPSVEHSQGGYFELYFGLRDTECIHLECRLTGDLAVEFYDLWKQRSRNTVICIIKFVKLELSQEHRWRCTNVTGSTTIMLNPDLSITDEMLCWNPENDQVPIITRKENAME
ncbi:unnamed protein product [Arabidopsis lyrata]|nr:unnamed protein product [Arabidopsis lyrata]